MDQQHMIGRESSHPLEQRVVGDVYAVVKREIEMGEWVRFIFGLGEGDEIVLRGGGSLFARLPSVLNVPVIHAGSVYNAR